MQFCWGKWPSPQSVLPIPPSSRSAQRRPRLVHERGKRGRITDGQFREDLPIDLDAGLLEPVHEDAVAHVVLMRRGVDAGDPEATEVALLVAAIAVCVPPAALDSLLRRSPQLAARAKCAARGFHDLLFALQAH